MTTELRSVPGVASSDRPSKIVGCGGQAVQLRITRRGGTSWTGWA